MSPGVRNFTGQIKPKLLALVEKMSPNEKSDLVDELAPKRITDTMKNLGPEMRKQMVDVALKGFIANPDNVMKVLGSKTMSPKLDGSQRSMIEIFKSMSLGAKSDLVKELLPEKMAEIMKNGDLGSRRRMVDAAISGIIADPDLAVKMNKSETMARMMAQTTNEHVKIDELLDQIPNKPKCGYCDSDNSHCMDCGELNKALEVKILSVIESVRMCKKGTEFFATGLGPAVTAFLLCKQEILNF